MASSSFLLSTSITGSKLSAAAPPRSSVSFKHRPFSVSAAYSTAERTSTATTSSSTIASHTSLYEVLGIQFGANSHEIKSAYRKLARILHPDVRNSSAEDFIRVQSAYATLSDPEKRANYDRNLFGNRIARPVDFSPAGARSHYTVRRGWETDQCW